MRVLLDATFARRGPSGTAVYIEQLAPALREAGVDLIEVANERRGAPGGGLSRSLANYAGDRRWVAFELPSLARRHRADVIHHPLPAHCPRAPCAQVITVHDLAFVRMPELFDRRYAIWAKRSHRAAARRADAVICVSRAVRRDVRERWGLDAQVAHHGPGQVTSPLERGEARHFLYVGDAEPRKDVKTLRAAHARLGAGAPPLVLAGAAGEAVSRERLCELHAQAIALVHPARHEGFGLTVLEAMALGTPVLAARCEAVEEVAGEAIRYFEPGDAKGLATALAGLAGDAEARARLSQAGLRRAGEFSWQGSARAHVAAYTLACR